jgi:hypothetical protein
VGNHQPLGTVSIESLALSFRNRTSATAPTHNGQQQRLEENRLPKDNKDISMGRPVGGVKQICTSPSSEPFTTEVMPGIAWAAAVATSAM